MSDQTDTKSNFIDVDLEQWRRDIDTFAAATSSALDAIITELSTACSGGQVRSAPKSFPVQAGEKRNPVTPQAKHEAVQTRSTTSLGSTDKSASSASSGSRLASLKEKLASRMNKI